MGFFVLFRSRFFLPALCSHIILTAKGSGRSLLQDNGRSASLCCSDAGSRSRSQNSGGRWPPFFCEENAQRSAALGIKFQTETEVSSASVRRNRRSRCRSHCLCLCRSRSWRATSTQAAERSPLSGKRRAALFAQVDNSHDARRSPFGCLPAPLGPARAGIWIRIWTWVVCGPSTSSSRGGSRQRNRGLCGENEREPRRESSCEREPS